MRGPENPISPCPLLERLLQTPGAVDSADYSVTRMIWIPLGVGPSARRSALPEAPRRQGAALSGSALLRPGSLGWLAKVPGQPRCCVAIEPSRWERRRSFAFSCNAARFFPLEEMNNSICPMLNHGLMPFLIKPYPGGRSRYSPSCSTARSHPPGGESASAPPAFPEEKNRREEDRLQARRDESRHF